MNKTIFRSRSLHYLFVLGGLFAFRSSLADQYVIPSGSMEPTIQIGDHVLVDKRAYDLRVPFTEISVVATGEPHRGDIVVFRDPRDPSINLIKRLVGLPGDRIRVIDGRPEVNGVALAASLPEPELQLLLAGSGTKFAYLESGPAVGMPGHAVQRIPGTNPYPGVREFKVPPGEYFFLGDNRDRSADSREWGFAPRKALRGRAVAVLYSVRWPEHLGDGWPRVGPAHALD